MEFNQILLSVLTEINESLKIIAKNTEPTPKMIAVKNLDNDTYMLIDANKFTFYQDDVSSLTVAQDKNSSTKLYLMEKITEIAEKISKA